MKQFLFLTFLLFFIACDKKSQQPNSINVTEAGSMHAKVDEYFSALNKIGKFNGVIFVEQSEEIILDKAYNINQDRNSSTFVKPDSQFDIHSVSKLMAHYLIEKFELEGKVNKGQTIDVYIPDFPRGNEITIGMLLNHTSGLPRRFDHIEGDAIDLSSSEIIEATKKQALLFDPGTDSQYSNVGFEIVYFILEVISDKTFAQCLTDEVFVPLGMDNSGAHFHVAKNKKKELAKNHEKKDSVIVTVDNILPDELKTARIFSTATDLNKFLNHLRTEPYASLLKDESEVIEKNGGSDGIRVEIYTNLTFNYNFIILANYDEIPFQQTVVDLTHILEDKPYTIPKELNRQAITLSPAHLAQFEGTFTFADMGNIELSFKANDNGLSVYQNQEIIGSLLAESEYVFFEDPKEPESFEFIKDEQGRYYVLMGWKGVKLKGVQR